MDSRSITRLPVELLAEITHNITIPSHLKKLAVVSSLFNRLAEQQLYSNVVIFQYRNVRRFQLALRARPERQRFVRTVYLNSTDSHREWTPCMLCPDLTTYPKLKTIEFTSKYCHSGELVVMPGVKETYDDLIYYQHDLYAMFRRASLASPPSSRQLSNLTTLRLHFINIPPPPHWADEYEITGLPPPTEWDLGPDLIHIFLSPTLRDVTLFGCRLGPDLHAVLDDDVEYRRFRRSTPLESLRLLSCLPDPAVLRKLFQLPRGLRHFCLEPNFENDGDRPLDWGEASYRDLDAWTSILTQQKHALEEVLLFAFDDRHPDYFDGCLDLRAMEKIKVLAGTIFMSNRDNVKRPPGAKGAGTQAYYGWLNGTKPDWFRWADDDLERLADEQGNSYGDPFSDDNLDWDLEEDMLDDDDEVTHDAEWMW